MPSGFETGEESAVSDFVVVLRPVFVVLLWSSDLVLMMRERAGGCGLERDIDARGK